MGIRVTPDDNDIVVWKLDEATAPFINSSTSPNAISTAISNLTTLSGAIQLQQPSPFAPYGTNSAILVPGTQSNSPRNFISGANGVEPLPPFTISGWIYIRTYLPLVSGPPHIIVKQFTTGSWNNPWYTVTLEGRNQYGAPSRFRFGLVTSSGFSPGSGDIDPLNTIPLNTWSHIGLTYDGSTQTVYLNGNLVSTASYGGTLNYNGGPWFFGGIPAGFANAEEAAFSACDFRIANVIRPQSYFKNIYELGAMASGQGVPLNTYYKLRALDLGCSNTSYVYWVSKIVNYNNAPAPSCGGPLGDIEIMETWKVLG